MSYEIPASDMEFVEKIAYKYFIRSNYYVELDDLIQEGLLAYVKEREKYDETKNNFFMGYAYLRISGAIKDYIGRNSPKGGATVRPNSIVAHREVYTFTALGIDENELEDNIVSTVEDEIIIQEFLEEFTKYISQLNTVEQQSLYKYFILNESIVKISEQVKISRVRVKKLLVSCLTHMRNYFDIDDYPL